MTAEMIGARLRRLREGQGWDVATMARRLRDADRTGVLPANLEHIQRRIRRWEHGHNRPHERYRLAYGSVFGIDAESLFSGTPSPSPSEVSSRALAPIVDEEYVQSIRDANAHLVGLDGVQGGDHLVDTAVALYRSAHRRVATAPSPPALRRDLRAAVAEAGEIAGWVAYDADRPELARRLTLEALADARLAGDTSMERFCLTNLAMLAIHVHAPGEAAEIAETELGKDLPRGVQVLFALRRARAHGQYGERRRALEAIARAHSLHSDGPSSRDPVWTWWLDPGEIRWHEAQIHADLGDWPTAVDLFARVTEERQRPNGRNRAAWNDQAHLLHAYVRVEAWDQAEALLKDYVLPLSPEIASSRTSSLLRTLLPRLKGPNVQSSLRDTADVLSSAL